MSNNIGKGPDQPLKSMVKTKTKMEVGVAISIGLITLTLVFLGSMFLLAGAISTAKVSVSRARPSPTLPTAPIVKPPVGECGALLGDRTIIMVPSPAAATIEDAIRAYGSRPLRIRVSANVPSRVMVNNWKGNLSCPNIIEKDPATRGEVVVSGLTVSNASNLIVQNLTFEGVPTIGTLTDVSPQAVVYMKSDIDKDLRNISFIGNKVRYVYGVGTGICFLPSPVSGFESAGVRVDKGTNVIIKDNKVESCFTQGILVRGTRDSQISNNHVNKIFKRGIWIRNTIPWTEDSQQNFSYYSNNIKVDHNRIEANKSQYSDTPCLEAGLGVSDYDPDASGTINYFYSNDVAADPSYFTVSSSLCTRIGFPGPNGILFKETGQQKADIKNNIFFDSKWGINKIDGSYPILISQIVHNYNDYYNDALVSPIIPYGTGFTAGTDEITSDPGYTRVGSSSAPFNFRLNPTSTFSAIDLGERFTSSVEPSRNGCRVNLGSYGNTALATPRTTADPSYPNCP